MLEYDFTAKFIDEVVHRFLIGEQISEIADNTYNPVEDIEELLRKRMSETAREIDALKKAQQPRWISVGERLPDEKIDGDTSDGYHTFNELYHHRAVLFSVIVKAFPERAWKSRKHHDGTMYDGMFIVGIDTPQGQATYHYDVDPYWEMFACRELDRAPEWDGHTSAEAISRIGTLEPVRHGRWIKGGYVCGDNEWKCSVCGETEWRGSAACMKFCMYCGAKDGGEEK